MTNEITVSKENRPAVYAETYLTDYVPARNYQIQPCQNEERAIRRECIRRSLVYTDGQNSLNFTGSDLPPAPFATFLRLLE